MTLKRLRSMKISGQIGSGKPARISKTAGRGGISPDVLTAEDLAAVICGLTGGEQSSFGTENLLGISSE